ncbi:hypothetical protein PPROV_000374100 [Pycnococcus provasolii]|uniref:Secreted protein n=1 Tax=Pycnococcus provasolii TaxID=41880 RepID=A0A830HI63_9CHLO|nr:hypothetical protein PPROV_000374100 [Pycnococcus provasolii]
MLRLLTSSFLCAAALAAKDSHDDHNHGGGSCASDHCKAAFQTVLMAHDTCKDEQLPKTLETKLHFFEDGCESHWCNTVTKPFDPMAVECGTGNDAYEWAGTFNVADASHTWSMQAVGGKYADPAMRLVFIPTTDTTEGVIKTHEAKAVGMMTGTSCAVTNPGSTSKIEQGGSCFEMTVGSAEDSEFTLDTTGISGVVIYAQHVPTEFERNRHYLYDSKSTDIEPVAQVPKPSGGGGHDHGHSHDHGHGHGSSEPCGCWAKKYDFPIDCANAKTTVAAAVDYLQKNICENKKEDEACKKQFAILNTHHDYCYHDDLPMSAEIAIHSYEDKFASCIIGRQFSDKVSNCPIVDCTKMPAMDAAIKELDEECKPVATTTPATTATPATKDSTPTTTKAKSAASSPSYVVAGFTFLSGVMAYVL